MGDLLINTLSGNSKKPLFGAYVIMSGSMVPTIQIKDGIIIQRGRNNHYEVGDIITFTSSDTRYEKATITHRIVGKKETYDGEYLYTTKGDHNRKIDDISVKESDIYGKVLFTIPRIGYLQDFFAKPCNYFSCLLVFTLLFIAYQGCKIFLIFMKEKRI